MFEFLVQGPTLQASVQLVLGLRVLGTQNGRAGRGQSYIHLTLSPEDLLLPHFLFIVLFMCEISWLSQETRVYFESLLFPLFILHFKILTFLTLRRKQHGQNCCISHHEFLNPLSSLCWSICDCLKKCWFEFPFTLHPSKPIHLLLPSGQNAWAL